MIGFLRRNHLPAFEAFAAELQNSPARVLRSKYFAFLILNLLKARSSGFLQDLKTVTMKISSGDLKSLFSNDPESLHLLVYATVSALPEGKTEELKGYMIHLENEVNYLRNLKVPCLRIRQY